MTSEQITGNSLSESLLELFKNYGMPLVYTLHYQRHLECITRNNSSDIKLILSKARLHFKEVFSRLILFQRLPCQIHMADAIEERQGETCLLFLLHLEKVEKRYHKTI